MEDRDVCRDWFLVRCDALDQFHVLEMLQRRGIDAFVPMRAESDGDEPGNALFPAIVIAYLDQDREVEVVVSELPGTSIEMHEFGRPMSVPKDLVDCVRCSDPRAGGLQVELASMSAEYRLPAFLTAFGRFYQPNTE